MGGVRATSDAPASARSEEARRRRYIVRDSVDSNVAKWNSLSLSVAQSGTVSRYWNSIRRDEG